MAARIFPNTPTYLQFKAILRTKYLQNLKEPADRQIHPFPTKYPLIIDAQLKHLENNIKEALKRLEYHRIHDPDHESPRYLNKAKFYSKNTLKRQRRISLEVLPGGQELLILKSVQPARGSSQKNYPALIVDKDRELHQLLVVNWSKSIKPFSAKIHEQRLRWYTHFGNLPGFQPLICHQEFTSKKGHKRSSTVTPYAPTDLFCFLTSLHIRKFNDADVIVKWVKTLITTMHTLYENDVRHADIKPENFLLTITGDLQLIDYGFMMTVQEERQTIEAGKGSPLYLSKEYVLGIHRLFETSRRDDIEEDLKHRLQLIDAETYISTKNDIWSAGIVLYTLLTSSHPFPITQDQFCYFLEVYKKKGLMQFYIDESLKNLPEENPIVKILKMMLRESSLERWNGRQCHEHLLKFSDQELKEAVKEILLARNQPNKPHIPPRPFSPSRKSEVKPFFFPDSVIDA